MARRIPKPDFVPSPLTAAVLHEKHRDLLVKVPAGIFEMRVNTIAKFRADLAAGGGICYMLNWDGPQVMQAEKFLALAQHSLTDEHDHLVELNADRIRRIQYRIEQYMDDVLTGADYRPRSTNPISNIEYMALFGAKQELLSLMRWLVWEWDYIAKLAAMPPESKVEEEENPIHWRAVPAVGPL